ncbi:toxin-antitoxin system HicB family antitoxin [Enterobacter hormaechei]|uniref:toxin-antitoxin system HicB family antitoxin n=1 Tax=Enterobacter hormaechei TaxID=158836 RepID=UPI0011E454E8|nr:toxin-antitoxin system HicB family antitoxin [Enterobacter hormaechei]TYF78132.1 toxin-antitoxin system HicB family antitoxin [Enterobacter hormaechei]
MSTILRDKSPKGAGKAPMFNVRISPDLKEQFELQAKKDGVSLGNWLKELGRMELRRRSVEPKG